MRTACRLLAAALAAAVLLVACDDDAHEQPAAAEPVRVVADAPTLATTPGWQHLGRVPRKVNAGFAVAAWTGKELLLWGGNRTRDCSRAVVGGRDRPEFESPAPCDHSPREGLLDGVALDPVAHRWRSIPRPPLDVPIVYPSGVWDGRELIVTGQSCWAPTAPDACYPGGFAAVAYDPERNSWENLPALPSAFEGPDTEYAPAVGWAGRLAVFDRGNELVGYDPAARRWSTLRDDAYVDACASGHRIVAIGGAPALHFEVRSDRDDGEWTAGPNIGSNGDLGQLPDQPLHCTASGAALLTYDRVAYDFDAARNTVTKRPPPGIHGNWYGISTSFAPLDPDGAKEVDLPRNATAVFDAGRRVYVITNDGLIPCERRPCSTSQHDRVETLLRH